MRNQASLGADARRRLFALPLIRRRRRSFFFFLSIIIIIIIRVSSILATRVDV